ncbi:MAG TPA: XrtA/PEP-CTERM system histidine kinase PrsK [Thermodesulfobacteriota bacterium]|nr:XrtA/PEP-CTERM system histidine kinase PrsK [Thermodesulfobacteriota bacterium]
MSFPSIVSFVAAGVCGGLGILVLVRDRHSFVHWTFAAGMIVLALEALLSGLSVQAELTEDMFRWQRMRLITTAFIPVVWLLFSLSFSRKNYREFLIKIKWLLVSSFALPLILVTLFNEELMKGGPVLDESSAWLIPLDWSGYLLHLFFLLSIVIILMNLERTFRASTGHMRWQIKFLILGLGSLFAVRIYTGSQALLFWSIHLGLEGVNSATLIIACALMVRSLFRIQMLNFDFYLSHSLIYNSFTVLIIGIYFLAVGILAKIISYFGDGQFFSIQVFVIFIAFVVLTIFFLSDRARHKIRGFISSHLKRPQYDYRKEWTTFTQRTSRLMATKDLCSSLVKMISDTFEVLAVTVWLLDESRERLLLGGSTVFSELQTKDWKSNRRGSAELIRAMRDEGMPIDLEDPTILWASELRKSIPEFFQELKIRYCIPVIAGGDLIGLLTLGDQVGKESLSFEQFDLLKTISDQSAASLLNIRLSEQLRSAKEMEAFQTISSFVVHDLKNLASTLSLTMQNLPFHFDNPEFRGDALRVISQSVAKIKGMCGSLSTLSQRIDVKKVETDLNRLIVSSLACLNDSSKCPIIQELQAVPRVSIDLEQIQKVLTNLILNANEAISNGGEIRVATEQKDGWIILSVSDNGCGMSKEFIEGSLFRPFKTTKKQGMGIGLFQSKMIVEAHQGRIEVDSEPGKGSTFRVMLPLKRV